MRNVCVYHLPDSADFSGPMTIALYNGASADFEGILVHAPSCTALNVTDRSHVAFKDSALVGFQMFAVLQHGSQLTMENTVVTGIEYATLCVRDSTVSATKCRFDMAEPMNFISNSVGKFDGCRFERRSDPGHVGRPGNEICTNIRVSSSFTAERSCFLGFGYVASPLGSVRRSCNIYTDPERCYTDFQKRM